MKKIETLELYFPGGSRSFYKIGMALSIPTKMPEIFAKTEMVVTGFKVSRILKKVLILLSNGERLEYNHVPFSMTYNGFSRAQDEAVERKMIEMENFEKPFPSP